MVSIHERLTNEGNDDLGYGHVSCRSADATFDSNYYLTSISHQGGGATESAGFANVRFRQKRSFHNRSFRESSPEQVRLWPRATSQCSPRISCAGWAVMLPIRSCTPLAFSVSSRSSGCFGRINMRGFLSSPLVVVGKGLKLTAIARSVMVWAARSKVCAVFRYSLPRCEICGNVIEPSRGFLAPGLRRFGARATNCGHLPGEL